MERNVPSSSARTNFRKRPDAAWTQDRGISCQATSLAFVAVITSRNPLMTSLESDQPLCNRLRDARGGEADCHSWRPLWE